MIWNELFYKNGNLIKTLGVYNLLRNDSILGNTNSPTWIPDWDSHSPALLDLFISLDASICSTMAFPPLGNADQVVVQVSIDFLSNSQWDSQFHCIAYDYSFAGWDGLCDLWEIFHEREYSAAAASEFCDCVQVGINVSLPHCKYQVKPHSPPWLSFACAAVVVHRNDFFVCTNKIIFLSQK